ncbi:hypothetical protein FQZ97_799970 [compost metagenome]
MPGDTQWRQRVDGDFQLVFVVLHKHRAVSGWGWHQPEAEFGHYAEIGLGEEAIQVRAKAILEYLPGVRVGQGAGTST